MTAKTFFNKGIYLSTVKRFFVGSVLYLLILLMGIFVMTNGFGDGEVYNHYFFDFFTQMSTLLAMGVSVVVAMIIYKFVHSKKSAVFTHSLPITRKANYISTVAAAFTLMGLPVVISTFVLMCVTGKAVLSIASMIVPLFTLFVMFAFSTVAAFLTGSAWAVLVLSILFHTVLVLVGVFCESIMNCFVFGYNGYLDSLSGTLFNFSVPVLLMNIASDNVARKQVVILAAILAIVAIALYVAAYFLYKYRKMEKCEDVAAFKVLNPIFKYFVALMVTLAGFSIFNYMIEMHLATLVIIMIIISVIGYFGMEMLLKKKANVFKESFVGYVVFAAVMCVFFGFVSGTSLFGYETYVPNVDDVKSAICNSEYYVERESQVTDKETIELILNTHAKIIDEKRRVFDDRSGWVIQFVYELNNGKEVTRMYCVDYDERNEIMSYLYENEDFKERLEMIFLIDEDSIASVRYSGETIAAEARKELFEAVKDDIRNLSYDDIYTANYYYDGIDIAYVTDEKDSYTRCEYIDLNSNYENTIALLKELGFEFEEVEAAEERATTSVVDREMVE